MRLVVSRGSIRTADGRKVCSRCQRRPAKKGQRWCRECHAEYMRGWRRGKILRYVTQEEWATIIKARNERS